MGRIVPPIHGRGEEELNDGFIPSFEGVMQGRETFISRCAQAWGVCGQDSVHERLVATQTEVHEARASPPPKTMPMRDGVGGDQEIRVFVQ